MGRALSLRAQLALQVAVGVASVVLLFLVLRAYIVQAELDRTARQRQAVGQVLANYVDAQLGDQLLQLARTAARLSQVGRPGAATLLEDLRSRVEAGAYGVFLLDASGAPIAADPPGIGAAGADLARRPEVVDLLAQGRSAVSGVHDGPGGRAQFGLVVPSRLVADGPPGAMGIIVDPTSRRLAELVEASLALGGRTAAEVVDQHGVVVAATARERALLPGRFVDMYMLQLRAREVGTAIAPPSADPAGERHLIVFTPLKNAPWGLALSGPEAEVLAPVRRFDPALVALALASLAILVGLAVLTARSVIGPVRSLIGAAGRIARGDLTSAVPNAGEGELRQLAGALEDMRLGLRQAEAGRAEVDRLKDELISSVSHELRTPLGYIKGYTTTLMRRDTSWEPETARGFLEIIDQSSDQMEELVDHLLDMSRFAEGVLAVSPEPCRLWPLAREVARRMAVRSAAHPIELLVPPELPTVLADSGRIQQVLSNLLDNAIKYSPGGGRITISAEQADGEIVVAVRDRGLGIPEEQLGAVFDRFHRGRDAEVMKIRGVGLGLPICRGIVEAHGGRIWAERAATRGTIMRFTLRTAPMDAETAPETRQPEAAEL